MAKAARKRATRRRCLPEEMVVWEILVRLPPNSLLRCRAVCRAWHRATSARDFLLAHHARQPSLPIFSGHNILAFDRRAATDDGQLHTVVPLDEAFHPVASCDGLLVLSKVPTAGSSSGLSICNPATREHALLGLPWDFGIMGMYPHRPTGEYRLLMQRRMCGAVADPSSKDQVGCYVFALGSGQPPRYIGWPETASWIFGKPVLVRDSLHWHSFHYNHKSNAHQKKWENQLLVFDTIAESFRQIREPTVRCNSYIFEVDGKLGTYTRNRSTEVIDIWVLGNYETEVWDLKYRVQLPVAETRMKFEEDCGEFWELDAADYGTYREFDVVSVDSGVLLLVFPRWLLHVDCDGKLVNRFYHGRLVPRISGCWLKQSLCSAHLLPGSRRLCCECFSFHRTC